MKLPKQMSKKELIKEYKFYYGQIENNGCFGVKDLVFFDQLETELEKRELSVYKSVEVF